MSKKQMDEFAIKLALTPEWVALSKEKLEKSTSRDEFVSFLVDFAAGKGFEITAQDVETMNKEYNRK